MIIIGETPDGRQTIQGHGAQWTETVEQRDERRAKEAAERVRRAAPDLLAVLLYLEGVHGVLTNDDRAKISAAIAKAKGAA